MAALALALLLSGALVSALAVAARPVDAQTTGPHVEGLDESGTIYVSRSGTVTAVSMETGERWQITPDEHRVRRVDINEEGTKVVFHSGSDDHIYVAATDGTSINKVTAEPVKVDEVFWEWFGDKVFFDDSRATGLGVVQSLDPDTREIQIYSETGKDAKLIGARLSVLAYFETDPVTRQTEFVHHDLDTNTVLARWPAADPSQAQLDLLGTSVIYATSDQGLQVYDLVDHAGGTPIHPGTAVSWPRIAPSGELAAFTETNDVNRLVILDLTDPGAVVSRTALKNGSRIVNEVWLPNSTGMVFSSSSGVVYADTEGKIVELGIEGLPFRATREFSPPPTAIEPDPPIETPEPIGNTEQKGSTQTEGAPGDTAQVPRSPKLFVLQDQRVAAVDMETRETEFPLGEERALRVAISPTGDKVAYLSYHSDTMNAQLMVATSTAETPVLLTPGRTALRGMAWNEAGDVLYFDDNGDLVAVPFVNGMPGEIELVTSGQGEIMLADVSNGTALYYDNVLDESLVVAFDLESRTVVAEMPGDPGPRPNNASLSKDALQALVVVRYRLHLWDLAENTSQPLRNRDAASAPTISPDGKYLLYETSGPAGGTPGLETRNVETGERVQRTPANPDFIKVSNPTWLPDSSGFVAGIHTKDSQTVRLFPVEGSASDLGLDGTPIGVLGGETTQSGHKCDSDASSNCILALTVQPPLVTGSELAGASETANNDLSSLLADDGELTDADRDLLEAFAIYERQQNLSDTTNLIYAPTVRQSNRSSDSALDSRAGRRLIIGLPLTLIFWAIRAAREEN